MQGLSKIVSLGEIEDGDSSSRLAEYAENTFQLHDALFLNVNFAIQPEPYRNSLGFYYGHSSAFAKKKLFEHLLIGKPDNLDSLLWRGVSPEVPFSVDPNIANLDPELLRLYVKTTNELLLNTINHKFGNSQKLVMKFDSDLWLILTILEHQRLHLATTLPHLMSLRAESNNYRSLDIGGKDFNFIDVPGVNVSFGREFNCNINKFGWDNEFGIRNISVPNFIVTQHPVTIAQFQQFINEDGYNNPTFWSEGGKRWKRGHNGNLQNRITDLNYYIDKNDNYASGMFPAYVNYYEAEAFARYAGYDLMSEEQFHAISKSGLAIDNIHKAFVIGDVKVSNQGVDLFGNVRKWVASENGFQPLDDRINISSKYYPDFSMPWYNKSHAVALGYGFGDTGHMTNNHFRDFMQKTMRYGGFHLTKKK